LVADKKEHLVYAGVAFSGEVGNNTSLGARIVEAGSVKRRELRVVFRAHDASQKQK
jgi:hypothetical protein